MDETFRRLGPARDELGPLFGSLLDVASHALALNVGHERPERGVRRKRVSWLELVSHRAGDLLRLSQASARDQHSGQRATRLARVQEAF